MVELLSVPLFPAWVVLNSVFTAVNTLQGKVTQDDINHTTAYKFVEIICELQV